MKNEDELVQTLNEIGFWAAERGFMSHAFRIFDAMTILRPSSIYPHIGRGVAMVFGGHAADGASYIKEVVLKAHPDSVEGKSFLVFALRIAKKDDEADHLICETLKENLTPEWRQVFEGYAKDFKKAA